MKDNFFGKPELWLLSCTLCLTVNNIKYFRSFKGEKNLVWHILKSLSTIVLFHLKKKNKPKLHIFVNYNFDSNIKNRTAVRNLLKKYIMNRCSACRQWQCKTPETLFDITESSVHALTFLSENIQKLSFYFRSVNTIMVYIVYMLYQELEKEQLLIPLGKIPKKRYFASYLDAVT